MRRKASMFFILSLSLILILGAVAFAQDSGTDPIAEDGTTIDEPITEEEPTEVYENLADYLNQLEGIDELDRLVLEKKLADYEENISLDLIISVVDSYVKEEMDLGETFVTLKNLNEAMAKGMTSENVSDLLNQIKENEDSNQVVFQAALELRKISMVDTNSEFTNLFSEKIAKMIEEDGEVEISELKKLASEYRKEARNNSAHQATMKVKDNNSINKNNINKANGNGNNGNQSEHAKGKSENKGNSNKPNNKGNSKSKK